MEVLEPDIDVLIVAYVIQVLIFAFLFISIINIHYHGSIAEWYNNIAVQYGEKISSLQDGYTDRPYSMKLLDSGKIKNWDIILEKFGTSLSKQILIVGYEKNPNGVIFYLPSTSLMHGLVGSKRNIEKATRVTAYNDGGISVHISQRDYDFIGLEITYHELCQRILTAFAHSINSFIKGNEREAIEILGGKDYIINRKIIFRKQAFSYLRIFTVATIVNILLNVGLIPYEIKVHQDEIRSWLTYLGDRDPWQDSYPFSGRHGLIGLNAGGGVRKGDEFIIKYKADSIIPNVYIAAGRINFDYRIVNKGLQNTSEGKIKFKAPFSAGEYRIFFDLNKEGEIHTININYSIYHVNSYSPFNPLVAFFLISIFIPIEYYWRKHKIIPINKKE